MIFTTVARSRPSDAFLAAGRVVPRLPVPLTLFVTFKFASSICPCPVFLTTASWLPKSPSPAPATLSR